MWHGVDGQRCLLQLKPDPLYGTMTFPVPRELVAAGFAVALAAGLELRSPFEWLPAELFLLVAGEDTRFAPGYSDDLFRQIRLGDSEAKVRDLLGPGVWEHSENDALEVILYSDSPSSTHYGRRVVVFDEGQVSEVITAVWVD